MNSNSTVFKNDEALNTLYEDTLEYAMSIIRKYTEEEVAAVENTLVKTLWYPSGPCHLYDMQNPLPFSDEDIPKMESLRLAIIAKKTLEEIKKCLIAKVEIPAAQLVSMTLYVAFQFIYVNTIKETGHFKKDIIHMTKISKLKAEESKGIKIYEGSKKGLDKRHHDKRLLYTEALEVAEDKWLDGCEMKHNKMKDWLLDEYQTEDGRMPFTELPESGLKKKLKELLYRIDRTDLILGLSVDPTS